MGAQERSYYTQLLLAEARSTSRLLRVDTHACLWSRLVAAFQPPVTIAFGRTPRENAGSAMINDPNVRHKQKL
jgi:hypothetical protein